MKNLRYIIPALLLSLAVGCAAPSANHTPAPASQYSTSVSGNWQSASEPAVSEYKRFISLYPDVPNIFGINKAAASYEKSFQHLYPDVPDIVRPNKAAISDYISGQDLYPDVPDIIRRR